ncbi:MAG TPA: hypothetical protein GYA10_15360 [Alphaproteobacteria bacterium]|nr:hypothetical protein [Alphaproteobacteria bacterium]
MIAALLYLIGLISVLVSIAIAGYSAPEAISRFSAAMDSGTANMVDTTFTIASSYGWVLTPIVGGLLLMAAGRAIMLLAAINRSLRGQG